MFETIHQHIHQSPAYPQTVHQHNAPVADQARLLDDLTKEARSRAILEYGKPDDNLVKGRVVAWCKADGTKDEYVVEFILNGRQHRVCVPRDRLEEFSGPEKAYGLLVEQVARKISEQLLMEYIANKDSHHAP